MTKHPKGVLKLKRLLSAEVDEVTVQKHLEANPWIITGAHLIDPPLVISQFQLGRAFRPDFVFFWRTSGGEFLGLVEIESPKLRAFNATDEFSQRFNHSVQQVRDWPHWILENQEALECSMAPLFENGWFTGYPTYRRAKLFLIAGRRFELSGKPKRKARWEAEVADLATLGVELRTWDGFISSVSSAGMVRNVHNIRCVTHAYARANDAPGLLSRGFEP
jgi:hypothetical protein